MLIFATMLILLLTALALLILRTLRPGFKYPWLVAVSGSSLALVSVFLWQLRYPDTISLPPWQAGSGALYFPTWVADGRSWPYALGLAALTAAVIWTSVVRNENEPLAWAGTLLLSALGISAVAAGNPITMILAWTAIDLAELATMLRSLEGEERNRSAIQAFALRLTGSLLAIWTLLDAAAQGATVVFDSVSEKTAILLILAAGLRLGVFPLQPLYRKENALRRGFGTTLRMVSAVTGLVLLARLPAVLPGTFLISILLLLTTAAALYAGWMWLRSSDEIVGRSFFVLGMTALATSASLLGNPAGSLGWGTGLLLSGGMLFLYSARQRGLLWFVLLGLWAISGLPFSLTASAWAIGRAGSWPFLILLVLGQALLLAGCYRHLRHPGETSLESQERWSRVIYPTGLGLTIGTGITLGLWGWEGALTPGVWWLGLIVLLLAAGLVYLAGKFLARITLPASLRGPRRLRLDRLPTIITRAYQSVGQLFEAITTTLEGDGGLLWSFLLLVLILSLLATGGSLQ